MNTKRTAIFGILAVLLATTAHAQTSVVNSGQRVAATFGDQSVTPGPQLQSATPLFIIGNLAVGIWARVPRPYDVTAWKAAASAANAAEPVAFVPLGVVGEAGTARRPLLAPPEADRSPTSQADVGGAGTIEIALPNGVRICVAGLVSQKALSRVLRAMRGTL